MHIFRNKEGIKKKQRRRNEEETKKKQRRSIEAKIINTIFV